MGYLFANNTQEIDYGSHFLLYQSQSLSVGFWVYFMAGIGNDTAILCQEDTFPIIRCTVSTLPVGHGYGVNFFHVLGGAATFGVSCVPGSINPRYLLTANKWLYFGVSRDFSSRTYQSYFGSRSAMIEGQSFTFAVTQVPFPFGTPGQNLGPWTVGHGGNGMIVGPANYWDVALTREQHLSMARCTLPTGVDPVHLLWWTKMFEGAADVGPVMYANTFLGTPLPTYVADGGCSPRGAGQDYRLYNT